MGEMGPFSTATYLTQTRRTGSWYDDISWFVFSDFPLFFRGGYFDYGLDAGVFAFAPEYGRVHGGVTFRLTLTPTGGTS